MKLGGVHKGLPDKNRERYLVESIHVHEMYRLNRWYWGYDVAVLVLKTRVSYTDYIQPVCLPQQEDFPSINTLSFTAGWGLTDVKGTV